jgi:uncharacterized membrane protein
LCLEEEEARALVPGLVLPDNSVALFMPHGLNLHPRRYLEVEHHTQSFIGFFFSLLWFAMLGCYQRVTADAIEVLILLCLFLIVRIVISWILMRDITANVVEETP